MNILILTFADGHIREMGDFSALNKQWYAEQHGYDFVYEKERLDTRPASWSKILHALRHLPACDWLFWTDADSLVMNSSISLESIIGGTEKDFIFCVDETRGLNAGQFFVRNCDWSARCLRAVYDNDKNWKFWEQDAFIYLFRNPVNGAHVDYRPQRQFNSFLRGRHPSQVYQKGDFILHFVERVDRVKNKARVLEEMKRAI